MCEALSALERHTFPLRNMTRRSSDALAAVLRAWRAGTDAHEAIEAYLQPCLVQDGPDHLTGFYEPVVHASRRRDEQFQVPLHSRPHSLERNPSGGEPA